MSRNGKGKQKGLEEVKYILTFEQDCLRVIVLLTVWQLGKFHFNLNSLQLVNYSLLKGKCNTEASRYLKYNIFILI